MSRYSTSYNTQNFYPPEDPLTVKRSPLSLLGGIFIIAGLVAVIEGLHASLGGFTLGGSYVSLRWLLAAPLLGALGLLRRYYDRMYVFGPEFVTAFTGRLSLSYNVPRVNYPDIRKVRVAQSLLGRIFDYGDVRIHTAAMDVPQVNLMGIRDPVGLAALVDLLHDHVAERERRRKVETLDAVPKVSSAPLTATPPNLGAGCAADFDLGLSDLSLTLPRRDKVPRNRPEH